MGQRTLMFFVKFCGRGFSPPGIMFRSFVGNWIVPGRERALETSVNKL